MSAVKYVVLCSLVYMSCADKAIVEPGVPQWWISPISQPRTKVLPANTYPSAPHSTLYTLHSTLYTVHCTLCTVYRIQCSEFSVRPNCLCRHFIHPCQGGLRHTLQPLTAACHCTHWTHCTSHFTHYILQITHCMLHITHYTLHSAVHT